MDLMITSVVILGCCKGKIRCTDVRFADVAEYLLSGEMGKKENVAQLQAAVLLCRNRIVLSCPTSLAICS